MPALETKMQAKDSGTFPRTVSPRRNVWVGVSILETLLIFACLSVVSVVLAHAQTPDAANRPSTESYPGKLCTAYFPEQKDWSGIHSPGREWGFRPSICPHGSAVVATNQVPYEILISNFRFGWCCPLPDDALLDEHILVKEVCPAEYVVTGVAAVGSRTNVELRCTKVNVQRYSLGPKTPAVRIIQSGAFFSSVQTVLSYFGIGPDLTFTWGSLPPGIRYGIGRLDRNVWQKEVCAGFPWGSPLVAVADIGKCPAEHSELRYRGKGDAPGAPVKIFPDCIGVGAVWSDSPTCLKLPKDEMLP